MKLGEVLEQFRIEHLRTAVRELRKEVGWEQPMQKSGRPQTKKLIADYFEGRLSGWNDEEVSNFLKGLNGTSILIENPSHTRPALILCLMPTDMLEQVSLKLNIDMDSEDAIKAYTPIVR